MRSARSPGIARRTSDPRWLSHKPRRSSSSCVFATRWRFLGGSFRSRRCRSGRLSRSYEVGENGLCHIRTRGLVCATASARCRTHGVDDEMRVRERKQVSASRRQADRAWLVYANCGHAGVVAAFLRNGKREDRSPHRCIAHASPLRDISLGLGTSLIRGCCDYAPAACRPARPAKRYRACRRQSPDGSRPSSHSEIAAARSRGSASQRRPGRRPGADAA